MKPILISFSFSVFVLLSCSRGPGKLQQLDLINKDDSIGVTMLLTNNSIPADSVSIANVILTVDSGIYAKYRQVTFTIAPYGKFNNDSSIITVPIDLNWKAHVSVFSKIIGPSYITAIVGNITHVDSITFTTAWPDIISINPGVSYLTDSINVHASVTARLIRSNTGSVTPGLAVYFRDSLPVSGTTGKSVGTFLNSPAVDSAGFALTQYWLTDTLYIDSQYVYIIGTVYINGGADSVTGRSKILIR